LESIQSHPHGLYTPYKKLPQIFCAVLHGLTTDNSDITQSQTANHYRLLSYVNLGLVDFLS